MQTRVHINLNVRDLTQSVAFYSTLFGHVPTKVRSDYANFRLDTPALHLALVHKPAHPPTTSEQHFGVELFADADLGGWRERVQGAGLTARIEEQVTCCYAVANKFWVQDPDGNEWEFWVRHEEAEAMRESAAEGECCAPEPMPLTTLEGLAPKGASSCAPESGCC